MLQVLDTGHVVVLETDGMVNVNILMQLDSKAANLEKQQSMHISKRNFLMSNKWDNNTSSYGTYDDTIEERGNEETWKKAFETAKFSRDKSLGILAISNEDPHDVLGLPKDASTDDVKKAFRKLVITAHPDKGGSREEYDRIFAAYSLLI